MVDTIHILPITVGGVHRTLTLRLPRIDGIKPLGEPHLDSRFRCSGGRTTMGMTLKLIWINEPGRNLPQL